MLPATPYSCPGRNLLKNDMAFFAVRLLQHVVGFKLAPGSLWKKRNGCQAKGRTWTVHHGELRVRAISAQLHAREISPSMETALVFVFGIPAGPKFAVS
ncbi:hypothetical protein PsYK624_162110 [Phanerochaete sordida]|uniref:Uncharacterized protein n=1 Tax=Phanerochaete sordida TaxID=48140 RepID=A0A9P3GQJ7_9APHY|nr:hypothetical protein PsYK624_162110 [Phanerochaete sordida]